MNRRTGRGRAAGRCTVTRARWAAGRQSPATGLFARPANPATVNVDPRRVTCRDCEYSEDYPTRDHAEHAKRVHETETGHAVVIERVDGE